MLTRQSNTLRKDEHVPMSENMSRVEGFINDSGEDVAEDACEDL